MRLGWVEAATVSQQLVADIVALRDALRAEGVSRIVLCGMGGSSLAPEVIAGTAGVELTVLDSTDPEQVAAALADRLAETAIVVSSKSGSTLETDSSAGSSSTPSPRPDSTRRAGSSSSPIRARRWTRPPARPGYRAVFNADPNVGGRYSALTAFGMVPCGLAGVDIQAFLDEAEEAAEVLNEDGEENIGARARCGAGRHQPAARQDRHRRGRLRHQGLRATGPNSSSPNPPASSAPACCRSLPDPPPRRPPSAPPTSWWSASSPADADVELGENEVAIAGGLPAQMMTWEFATAVAGRLLGINPYDQPDVEAAKVAARGLLDAQPEPTPASFTDGAIEVRGGDWLGGADTPPRPSAPCSASSARTRLLDVQAYFDRLAYAPARGRPGPAGRRQRPSRDLRLGSALPALHRAVPQGRPRDRRLPAGDRRVRRRPGHPGPSVHLRRADFGPGRRRRAGTRPTTAARSSACTSRTAPPASASCRTSSRRWPARQSRPPKLRHRTTMPEEHNGGPRSAGRGATRSGTRGTAA